MNDINLIENHLLIRNTVGYDFISKIDIFDLPNVMQFLKIVDNYIKLNIKT